MIVERRIDPAELRRLVDLYFVDMVKLASSRICGERTTTPAGDPTTASSTRR